MSHWRGVLSIQMAPGDDGQSWTVNRPMAYVTTKGPKRVIRVFEVTPGFVTDGASIPRFFWRVIGCPLRGRYAPAAVMHDCGYATQRELRKAWDRRFREMLLDLGLVPWKAGLMFVAVRAFGWIRWNKATAETIFAANGFFAVT